MLPPAALLLLAAVSAKADVVVLSSDVFVEGVVIDETPTDVKLQVSDGGYAVYKKDSILSLQYDPPGTNSALRKKWRNTELREEELAERAKDAEPDEDDDPPPPMPLRSEQPPINVTVNVNVQSAPGYGVIVGPGHLSETPAFMRDRFAPHSIFNPRPSLGPGLTHSNFNGPSPANINVNVNR
jgi:hypothetical protein